MCPEALPTWVTDFSSSLSWIAQYTDFHLKSADSRNLPQSHR